MKNRTVIEIGGLLSVIGSLIFVGVEINQNTAAVRGATQQAISEQVMEMYKLMAEEPELAALLGRAFTENPGIDDFALFEQVQLEGFFMMGIRRIENIFLQYKNGFVNEDAFDRVGMGSYQLEFTRELWENNKSHFDPEFVTFFENLRDSK